MAFVSWGWHLARMHQIKNSETDHRTCKTRAPLTSSVALLVYITYLQITSSSKWFVALSTLSLKAAFSITFPFSRSWKTFYLHRFTFAFTLLWLCAIQGELQVSSGKERRLFKALQICWVLPNVISLPILWVWCLGTIFGNWNLYHLCPVCSHPTRALLSGVKDAFFWCNTYECILDYKWEKQQCSIWFKSRIRQM